MLFVLGLLVLLFGLVISVALHELGHMLPAKKFGSLVPEYWIGFGPTLWKTKRGGTTYGVKALPLGGYVRILGMFPPSPAGRKVKADGSPTLPELARQESEADVARAREAGATGKAFHELTAPQKLVVMLGGPVMNLLLALVLTAVVVLGFGWSVPSTTISEVKAESAGEATPAAAAGLQAGDTIVSWDGVQVESWDQLTELIAESEGPAVVVVERDGRDEELQVEPSVSADGTHFVGIVSSLERQRGSVGEVFYQVGQQVALTAKAIVALPVSLFETTKSIFTGEERDSSGVVSIVGVARMAGEITSTPVTTDGSASYSVGMQVLDRVALMISLLAALNVALFVFNLIPLPPLDGGHVAGAAWGGLKNVSAKVRGKPQPAPADTARMVPLSYGVFAALMVMTVILVIADVVRPITLT